MPWVWRTICVWEGNFLSCSDIYMYVPEGEYGGGGVYVPPTYVATVAVSVDDQEVTVTWTHAGSDGTVPYQTNANVAIKNASNVTVASVNVTTPLTAVLTVPEGQGYRAEVNAEVMVYPNFFASAGTSATFDVGPPPPPPPPPIPPFVPSMGMMGT